MTELDENISRLFSELGEDAIVSKVYAAVLQRGPLTVDDLAQGTNLDFPSVLKAINRLTTIPLITADMDRKHRIVYRALPPHPAFDAIVTAASWQTRKAIIGASDSPQSTGEEQTNLEVIRRVCDQLAKLTVTSSSSQSPIRTEMVTVARNREQMISYVTESITHALAEVVAVVSPPHLLGPLVWEAIVSRMRSGVTYRRITVFDEIVRHGLRISKREHEETGVDIYYIEPDKMNQKFYVIDKEVVVFFNPDQDPLDFEFAGQVIRNKELALRYVTEFSRLKKQAIPASFLLRCAERARGQLLQRASTILENWEMMWLENKIDYGLFDTLKLNEEKERSVRNHVVSAGLALISNDEIIPDLRLNYIKIREKWESGARGSLKAT